MAVWNGPRERARAETVSQGLYDSAAPGFCGPGRYLAPRHADRPIVRDPGVYPGDAAVTAALAGDTPPTIRLPRSQTDRLLPVPPAGEVPWEKNSPRKPGFTLRRDQAGSAQVLPPSRVDHGFADYVGRELFSSGQPDNPAGPICAYCFKPFTPSTRGGRTNQQYCCATHRKYAGFDRRKAAQRN